MFSLSNFITTVEILAAELIFLYSFPKRNRFLLRLLGALVVCLLAAAYLPESVKTENSALSSLYTFFRYIYLLGLTIGAMAFSYKAAFTPVLSACAAGYAVQHASSRLAIIVGIAFPALFSGVQFHYRLFLLEAIVFPFVYLLAALLCGRAVAKKHIYRDENPLFSLISVAMVLCCIGFSRLPSEISVWLFAIALCVFALLVQFAMHSAASLREENRAIKRVMEETAKRYESSKENVDLINIKCHDLKYRLLSLDGKLSREEIDSMLKCVDIYDRTFSTNNEALDTILAEKSLQYQKEGVEFTFMGDGKALSFMKVTDIYALFGNALDNAIEAVKRLREPEKRVISLTIEDRGELVAVNISNYFEGKLVFEGGLPSTSKEQEPGYHGFGLKSIRLIMEEYGGSMTVSVDGGMFNLGLGFLRK